MEICAGSARHVAARSAAPICRFESSSHAKVGERIDPFGNSEVNATAVTAVAAIRSAARNELLASKAHAAPAAVACFDTNLRFVDEFHNDATKKKAPTGGASI
jgi:hypothetical protein